MTTLSVSFGLAALVVSINNGSEKANNSLRFNRPRRTSSCSGRDARLTVKAVGQLAE